MKGFFSVVNQWKRKCVRWRVVGRVIDLYCLRYDGNCELAVWNFACLCHSWAGFCSFPVLTTCMESACRKMTDILLLVLFKSLVLDFVQGSGTGLCERFRPLIADHCWEWVMNEIWAVLTLMVSSKCAFEYTERKGAHVPIKVSYNLRDSWRRTFRPFARFSLVFPLDSVIPRERKGAGAEASFTQVPLLSSWNSLCYSY